METVGSFLVIVLLSMTGVGAPGVAPDVAPVTCDAQAADSCATLPQCDVFPAEGGGATCRKACDMRTDQTACESDGACSWSNGACQFPTTSEPIGC